MFIRKNKNRSGSISVQIISKSTGKYKVLKTIGCGGTEQEIQNLTYLANQEIERLSNQPKLFVSEKDSIVDQVFSVLENSSIRTVGPEIIFGKIYDSIGFNAIEEDMFRHLVVSRLVFPLSKLKTVEYLYRYQGVLLDIDSVYRFLDKLNSNLKDKVEQISYAHTLKVLQNNISIVFYDMTTIVRLGTIIEGCLKDYYQDNRKNTKNLTTKFRAGRRIRPLADSKKAQRSQR